jgi:hypothetical protein
MSETEKGKEQKKVTVEEVREMYNSRDRNSK